MSMILPRGFIVNSDQINPNIERLDAQPVEEADLARLWKVYTTTKRRLQDPTAERLENLWWRIWGSRGKKMRGSVVAMLFAEVSDGETFVPLHGPPNRNDGDESVRTPGRPTGQGSASTTALQHHEQNKTGTDNSRSSQDQVPMPHPILKKTKGPSNAGPKPTARFISPNDTEDDTSPDYLESPNAHVVVEPPSPQDPGEAEPAAPDRKSSGKKKASGTFSASSRKRGRPMIVKRQSSQNSNEGLVKGSPQTPTVQSSSETPPTFTTQSRGKGQSRFQENFSLTSDPTISKPLKSRGSSQASSSNPPPLRKPSSGTKSRRPKTIDESGDPGPSTASRRDNNPEVDVVDPETFTAEELAQQRIILEEANARVERRNQQAMQMIEQAQAEAAARQVTSKPDPKKRAQHDFKSKSTVSLAPTLTSPTGQMNIDSLGEGMSSNVVQSNARSASTGKLDKGKGKDPEEVARAAMFVKRPVQRVQTVSEPNMQSSNSGLARSKSQLTLLLERDRLGRGNGGCGERSEKGEKSPKE